MKSVLLAAVVVTMVGCNGQPFAPDDRNLEPLAVFATQGSRTAGDEERIPDFQVTSSRNLISVHVATHAVCGTAIINAGISRQNGEINVVARLSSGPLADCGVIPFRSVSDYRFTVSVTPDARYKVNVFEARGAEAPELVGSKSINVASADQ